MVIDAYMRFYTAVLPVDVFTFDSCSEPEASSPCRP